MSRRWIVWVAGVAPAGTIWALDRRTKRRYRVAAQPFSPARPPCSTLSCTPSVSFSLDGNTVVWTHFQQGLQPDWMMSSIRSKILPRGRMRTLYVSKGRCRMQTSPQLAAHRLVWVEVRWPKDANLASGRQCEGGLQTDVLTLAVGRHRTKRLTSDHESTRPDTNGNWVSWQTWEGASTACPCYSFDLLDMKTGRRVTLSTDAVDSELTSQLAVWIQSASKSTSVLALDLDTHGLTKVGAAGPLASANLIRSLAWTRGRRVAWERDVVYNPYHAAAFVGIRHLGKKKV